MSHVGYISDGGNGFSGWGEAGGCGEWGFCRSVGCWNGCWGEQKSAESGAGKESVGQGRADDEGDVRHIEGRWWWF